MSNFPVNSRSRLAVAKPGSGCSFRPAKRLTCAAIIALAVAGCSQEVQRFDYGDAREARTAQLHDNEDRYAEEAFASWRRGESGDLQRHAQLDSDPVTRSLPDDAGQDPRSQLTPLYDREPPPPRRTTHTVRAGDTLYSIARSHNVSVDKLAEINGLSDPSVIRIGDTLYIPEAGDGQRRQRRTARREEPRQAPRERRHAERRAPRYSDDQLYIDPLLSERPRREERRRYDAPRRAEEREAEPRRERASSAGPRRAASATPPPAPDQRPQTRESSQTARSTAPEQTRVARPEGQQPARIARVEPATEREVASEQKTSAAECSALMKNPPARSGANFRRPVNGLIVSRFGEQSSGQRNDGINISVPRGTPVKAAENGVVVYAGDELTGLGKLVLVRHADGWVSAYAHNDEIMVKRCDTVERGQTIARAGVTGAVTKPQLHFELRKNARPVDPEAHLAGTS